MTVGTIISFDGKDGFYLKENISIPPGAFKIEFRIDARELTTTTVAFENPRIIVGAFVGGMNNALMKKSIRFLMGNLELRISIVSQTLY